VRSREHFTALLSTAVALLTACGGGGSGGGSSGGSAAPSATATPAQQPKAEFVHGLYKGTSSGDQGDRDLIALFVSTGRVYLVTTDRAQPSSGLNVYFGNGIDAPTATAQTFTLKSPGIRDFPVLSAGPSKTLKVETVTLDATVIQENSIPEGKLGRTGVTVEFNALYDTNFNIDSPALSKVEGAYLANSVWGSTEEQGDSPLTNLTVTADGKITDEGLCKSAGEIAPHAVGNVYAITLRYRFGTNCSRGEIFVGHAIIEIAVIGLDTYAVLNVWAANDGFTNVLYLVGSRPL
jgi:hypothetical protein